MIISFFQHHENRKNRKNKVCPHFTWAPGRQFQPSLTLILRTRLRLACGGLKGFHCLARKSEVCPWLVLKIPAPMYALLTRALSFFNATAKNSEKILFKNQGLSLARAEKSHTCECEVCTSREFWQHFFKHKILEYRLCQNS